MGVRAPQLTLEALVRERLERDEDAGTAALIERLRVARDRGYLTAGELVRICRWKSPRATALVRSNSARRVRRATETAFRSMDERVRFEALVSLRGVSAPSASAVLTLLDPERYGVIDIRVWQLLHATGSVTGNARGAGFTFDQWLQFLRAVRDLAVTLELPARAVERTLFAIHRDHQIGTLYRASPGPRS